MLNFKGTEIKTKQDLLDRFDLKDALEQSEEFLLLVSRLFPSCMYPKNSLYDHCRKILSRILVGETGKNEIKNYITESKDFWSFPNPKDKRGLLSDTVTTENLKLSEIIDCLKNIFLIFKATEQTNDMWNVDFARAVATFLIVQEIAKESFSNCNSIIQEKFFLNLKNHYSECIQKLENILNRTLNSDGSVFSEDTIEVSKATADLSAQKTNAYLCNEKEEMPLLLPENGSVLSGTAHCNQKSYPYDPGYKLKSDEKIRTLHWKVEKGFSVILMDVNGNGKILSNGDVYVNGNGKILPNGDVYVNAVGEVVVSVLSVPKTDTYDLSGASSAVLLKNESDSIKGCVYISNGNLNYRDWGVDELDESWYSKKPFVEVAIDGKGYVALLNEKGIVFSYDKIYNGKSSVVSLEKLFNEVKEHRR